MNDRGGAIRRFVDSDGIEFGVKFLDLNGIGEKNRSVEFECFICKDYSIIYI